ncbi:MAG: hypothetical protein HFH62_03740 [Lachnospiraceae bacterium]|nr:hypothetical protein [Lachnospiraceae bacterium]
MALIDSSIFGIPFEGYDSYQNRTGGIKGVIAKAITMFDLTGTDMDKTCLATFTKDKRQAISFPLMNGYEMISFTTNDRAVAGTDGK